MTWQCVSMYSYPRRIYMAVNFSHAKIVNGKSEENVFSFGFQHLIPAVIITLNRMHS